MEQTYKVNLTKAELNVILNALAALSYRDSAGVINSLVDQARAQDAVAAKGTKPAVKDEK